MANDQAARLCEVIFEQFGAWDLEFSEQLDAWELYRELRNALEKVRTDDAIIDFLNQARKTADAFLTNPVDKKLMAELINRAETAEMISVV